jgi:TRAP-type C4-dicarboxylate transport system substrate-binding protein
MRIAAAILAGATALTAATTVLAQADLPETKLNVIGNLLVTTLVREVEKPFWNERIPAESGGRVTANHQAWEEAGLKGEEVHRIMQQGLAHIGHISLGRMTGDYPLVDASDLAGLSPSFEDLRKVVDAYEPVLDEFFQTELGLIPLTHQSFQAQILYCRDEVASLRDLQGKKVRASGASQTHFLEHFGASAVQLAFGEVQQALATGVVDCALTGTLGGYSARWYEAAKHLYTLPINYAVGVNVANKQLWDELDPAVQKFLTEEMKVLEDQYWAKNAEEGEVGILCNTTGPCPKGEPGGMTRHDPTDEDRELLRQALLESVLPKWAERCGPECVDTFNSTIGKATGLLIKE